MQSKASPTATEYLGGTATIEFLTKVITVALHAMLALKGEEV
jgi:hypothetical protein